jgi:hypothetical protein
MKDNRLLLFKYSYLAVWGANQTNYKKEKKREKRKRKCTKSLEGVRVRIIVHFKKEEG